MVFPLESPQKVVRNFLESQQKVLIKISDKLLESSQKVPQKVLRKFLERDEKIPRKSCEHGQKGLRTFLESPQKVLKKSDERCPKVLRMSSERLVLRRSWESNQNVCSTSSKVPFKVLVNTLEKSRISRTAWQTDYYNIVFFYQTSCRDLPVRMTNN